ncbi:Gp15 family bacteriophage protein [uncultured Anaerococcus sp.]|uniref:Gp15 family bacteriophage protein n=1 Tax=uncultured Anaerococcus sp. TaxID=293428 RepID=UPI0026091CA2|nr:Gp15 family bacteriophage protein [uncultured Anaerococcus sp.]
MPKTMDFQTNRLPKKVNVDGIDLYFNTDYRVWIEYSSLILNNEIDNEYKIFKSIDLCYKDGIKILNYIDLETAFNNIMRFFLCGKKEEQKKDNEKENPKAIYSFDEDWDYIYSAFFECYNIDLFEVDLHWRKFKSLFNSLSDSCQFSKILGFRAMTINPKMSKEQKKYYRKMKRLYALKDNRSAEEKESSFAKSLMSTM